MERLIKSDSLKTALYIIAKQTNNENIFIDAIIDAIDNQPEVINDFTFGYENGRKEGEKITAEITAGLTRRAQELQEENEMFQATADRLEREKEEFEAIAHKATEESKFWKAQHDRMETEFVRMRAQLDIVYLIFGGK